MYGEAGFTADDDGFDLTHEKALPAHLCEGSILDSISLGPDVHLLDVEVGKTSAERVPDPARLYEGEIARSRCDS